MKPRRALSRLAVPVLLGVATTVAVSWSAAVWGDADGYTFYDVGHVPTLVRSRVALPKDWTIRTWLVRHGFAFRHDLVSECVWMGSKLGWSESTAPNRTCEVVSVGWPLPALQWTTSDADSTWKPASWGTMSLREAWRGGLPQSTPGLSTGDPRRVPLRPTRAGFVADVAFYSLVAWGSVEGARRTRLALRRKRGACEGCGYDLCGLAPGRATCPECGHNPPEGGGASPATIPP